MVPKHMLYLREWIGVGVLPEGLEQGFGLKIPTGMVRYNGLGFTLG